MSFTQSCQLATGWRCTTFRPYSCDHRKEAGLLWNNLSATVNPIVSMSASALSYALPFLHGCSRDLARTSDDICNVGASGGDYVSEYHRHMRCVILWYPTLHINSCKATRRSCRQIAAWVVARMHQDQSVRTDEVEMVCKARRWPVARRPFDSWELLESDS